MTTATSATRTMMTERNRRGASELVRYLAALLAAVYLVAWWAFRLRMPPPSPPPVGRSVPAARARVPAPVPVPVPVRAAPARTGTIRTRSS
jgi:hypothetical protein